MQSLAKHTRSALATHPKAAASHGRPRLIQVVQASNRHDLSCPYETLGLQVGADEKTIKKAYRKLAKQYHPDVNKAEQTEVHFLNITEAYDFLLGLLRGPRYDDEGNVKPGNSEAFHDWYWSFRLRRNWERQKAKAEREGSDQGYGPTAPMAPQSAEGLQSQLAGLRHRAAIRRQKSYKDMTPAASRDSSVQEGAAAEPAFPAAAEEEDLFISADGPSDSAPVPMEQLSATPESGSQQAYAAGSRRKFVASTDSREALKQQMVGMRRKATLKQQINQEGARV